MIYDIYIPFIAARNLPRVNPSQLRPGSRP